MLSFVDFLKVVVCVWVIFGVCVSCGGWVLVCGWWWGFFVCFCFNVAFILLSLVWYFSAEKEKTAREKPLKCFLLVWAMHGTRTLQMCSEIMLKA